MQENKHRPPIPEIFPTREGIFFYDKLLNYLTFEMNEKGEVIRMIMHYEDGSEKAAAKE